MTPPLVYTYGDAARLLSVGLTTLKGLVKSKVIRVVWIGGCPRVPASELVRLATPGAVDGPESSGARAGAVPLDRIEDIEAAVPKRTGQISVGKRAGTATSR